MSKFVTAKYIGDIHFYYENELNYIVGLGYNINENIQIIGHDIYSSAIKIDTLIDNLNRAKHSGANFVAIKYDEEENGTMEAYHMTESTPEEILVYNNREKARQESMLESLKIQKHNIESMIKSCESRLTTFE